MCVLQMDTFKTAKVELYQSFIVIKYLKKFIIIVILFI